MKIALLLAGFVRTMPRCLPEMIKTLENQGHQVEIYIAVYTQVGQSFHNPPEEYEALPDLWQDSDVTEANIRALAPQHIKGIQLIDPQINEQLWKDQLKCHYGFIAKTYMLQQAVAMVSGEYDWFLAFRPDGLLPKFPTYLPSPATPILFLHQFPYERPYHQSFEHDWGVNDNIYLVNHLYLLKRMIHGAQSVTLVPNRNPERLMADTIEDDPTLFRATRLFNFDLRILRPFGRHVIFGKFCSWK